MDARLANHGFEAADFGGQDAAAGRSEAIVAAARIVAGAGGRGFLYQSLRHQFLEIVVKRSGTELVTAFGLAGHLLHDAVAVAVLGGKGEQDMQGSRRKRQVRAEIFRHSSVSVISNSE